MSNLTGLVNKNDGFALKVYAVILGHGLHWC